MHLIFADEPAPFPSQPSHPRPSAVREVSGTSSARVASERESVNVVRAGPDRPVVVGMLAHAVRWRILSAGAATGAFAACLLVGLILAPMARRRHMPFAAIGFASVVSMIPGVFLFRMASGLQQLANGSNTPLQVLGATIANGVTAFNITLAMSFGLILPKIVIDRLAKS
jgi:uncharacterized membrane protein YjjB (DUF3815 family)